MISISFLSFILLALPAALADSKLKPKLPKGVTQCPKTFTLLEVTLNTTQNFVQVGALPHEYLVPGDMLVFNNHIVTPDYVDAGGGRFGIKK